ncbi:hypothetical protein ISF6_3270 [Piscinibacter sakaiensis]|uniref:Uncharacterized protein n=1 Tax=Piscinibacter sakaiensis TaxID=1547922 RepID=A0A0K8P5D0_PISS1|nr:hypothetical protein ISF6_3270 [Piscinibacter sakaiensis]
MLSAPRAGRCPSRPPRGQENLGRPGVFLRGAPGPGGARPAPASGAGSDLWGERLPPRGPDAGWLRRQTACTPRRSRGTTQRSPHA